MRGIDRTLEYAEYTEEERPVSIQIFGGDPDEDGRAAQIVEGMGADIVDVNMGCPVPKIAKHNAGCSLMREPATRGQRDRGDDEGREDPGDGQDARRMERHEAMRPSWREVEDAGAAAVTVHGRPRSRDTADPRTGIWSLTSRRASQSLCSAAATASSRADRGTNGPGVERRARRPRGPAKPMDPRAGCGSRAGRRACRHASERGQFLLDYIELLLQERVRDEATAVSHDKWVINKLRALGSYYTKGLNAGRTCERRSTQPPRCRSCRTRLQTSSSRLSPGHLTAAIVLASAVFFLTQR